MVDRELTIAAEDVARYREGTAHAAAGDDPAPPLLYHSEVYRQLDWYLPNVVGNLHARQEWELHRAWRVGDVVRASSAVVERYRKRDRDYVVKEVVFTGPDGRLLQRSRTHQSFLVDDPGEAMVVDRARERRADRRFVLPEGPGEEVASAPTPITHAMCIAFSGPSQNYHTDVEMARALGFPDIVVQGMLSVCFVADLLTGRFGEGFCAGGRLDVRLVNVVWPGDVVTTRGKVREATAEDGRTRQHLDVWCQKGDGTVTLVGTASALA